MNAAHLDTAPKANVSLCSEFRVYAANAVMRRNRLKAELRTGAMRGCVFMNAAIGRLMFIFTFG
jgi:hypothetical protein